MGFIDPKLVIVPPGRQRKEFKEDKLDELIASCRKLAGPEKPLHVGQLHPILLTKDNILITGERRLRAFLKAGVSLIKFEFRDELDPAKLKAIEFEENAKRENLTWQEHCIAITEYHDYEQGLNHTWTLEDTAEALSLSSPGNASRNIQVGRALLEGNERIKAAGSISAAYNILDRQRQRLIDTECSQIEDLIMEDPAPAKPFDVPTVTIEATTGEIIEVALPEDSFAESDYAQVLAPALVEVKAKPSVDDDLMIGSFLEWAPMYQGRKFNFLHCDFPYGVSHHKTDQGGADTWGSYEDSPEVYWTLCQCLADNLDRVMFQSSHIMFWFSMNFYQETIEFFHKNTDLVVQPFPLVWAKSDGKGIVPDAQRQPRRIYETAFIMSRGDRKILKPKANLYSCPTSKELHISEKPEPMLRHFFEMFVDSLTEAFDPTCGSGGALRAADALGACRVQGMELNPEYAEIARTAWRQARNKAKLSEKVS